jgi:ribonuclease HII
VTRAVEAILAEAYRLRLMHGLEELLERSGFMHIAGVDEAGRGCLAGPVVAAAVIPGPGSLLPGVDDSKALGAACREKLAREIRASAPAWSVQVVSAEVIDRINILQATKRAMRAAVLALRPSPDCVLVDAVALPDLDPTILPLVRGDQISYAVACASILAKVERDRIMTELDARFPHFRFADNKGYGTAEHRRALEFHGPSPCHRLTFKSVLPRRVRRAG